MRMITFCGTLAVAAIAGFAAPNPDLRLVEAARNQDADAVRLLLRQHVDPNTPDVDGTTALIYAAHQNDLDLVKALLAGGANAKAANRYRVTALSEACNVANGEMIQMLLKAGADPNATVGDGETALMIAARQGAVESAQVLLDAGADVNMSEPEYHFTPILEAIYNDHYDLAAILVERKANPDGALYLAVEMRNLDYFGNRPRKPVSDKLDELAFIKFMLDHGADPNAVLKTRLPDRMAQGAIKVPKGATPFWRAARSADVAVMRLLLEKGANPSQPTDDHTTPLLAAATGQGARFAGGEERPIPEFLEALRICLDKGADINITNDRGDTPMHAAAERGADEMVQFLADHGAKLDVKNKSGRTPLDVAMGIGGVANTGGSVHPGTAELIRKLMARAAPQKVAQIQ